MVDILKEDCMEKMAVGRVVVVDSTLDMLAWVLEREDGTLYMAV